MTKQQFLLMKLAEECAEVAQRAIKQIQFGRLEVQEGQELSNGQRLTNELLDLEIIKDLLEAEFEIPGWTYSQYREATEKKKIRLQKYLYLSAQLKQLPEITL